MKKSSAAIALLVLAWMLAGRAATADPAPALAGGLLITDAKGVFRQEVHDRWLQPLLAALNGSATHFVGDTAVLAADAVQGLSGEQKVALLSAPDLLLSSSSAKNIFQTRWVVLAGVGEGDNPAIRATVYDTQNGDRHTLPDAHGKTLDDTLSDLRTNVSGYLDLVVRNAGTPVVGNVMSKLYHIKGADHVHAEDCIDFPSERDARDHGYEPCTICFPHENKSIKNDPTEMSLGREIAANIEYSYKTSRNEKDQEKVRRIGQRIVEANHLDQFPYTFTLLEAPEQNAFSAGAGGVFITTGLVNMFDSDDELAAVLGHEIAHNENHHMIKSYRQAQTSNIVGVAVSILTGSNLGGFLSNFFGTVINRGHSRAFEQEADHYGLLYSYAAGFRPEDFDNTLKKLKKLGENTKSGGGPAWLRTHPTEAKRLEEADKELASIHQYDALVQATQAADPGLARQMRSETVQYIDRQDVLSAFLAADKMLKVPAYVAPAPQGPKNQSADPESRD